MNYIASITNFFKSPQWMMNLLLAGVCALIPIVGPIVVLGWLITGFWSRQDDAPESFPDFNFDSFGLWLGRGLWPMLVGMVASMAVCFVLMIPMMIGIAVLGANANAHQGSSNYMGAVAVILVLGIELLMILTMMLVMKPLMLKATLAQDFAKSFDIVFLKSFVSRVWIEILLSGLFLTVASFALMLAGMVAFCVGIFLVPGLLYYSMSHLDKQLYNLYLSRGGVPVELSPKLSNMPPPLPRG
jgi:hypothetical protein